MKQIAVLFFGVVLTATAYAQEMTITKDSIQSENTLFERNSINFNTPLYILNNAEINFDNLKKIDLNKIESIEVLKEPSSLSLYGEKGKNGVVIIKMKTAKFQRESDRHPE